MLVLHLLTNNLTKSLKRYWGRKGYWLDNPTREKNLQAAKSVTFIGSEWGSLPLSLSLSGLKQHRWPGQQLHMPWPYGWQWNTCWQVQSVHRISCPLRPTSVHLLWPKSSVCVCVCVGWGGGSNGHMSVGSLEHFHIYMSFCNVIEKLSGQKRCSKARLSWTQKSHNVPLNHIVQLQQLSAQLIISKS